MDSVLEILSRRKKGSKRFKRAQTHRKNIINWSINQLNFKDVGKIKFEKLRNVRKGKSCSRKQSHWSYPLIKTKIVHICEEEGFQFIENENRFMSQRCCKCGWTHKSNRKGKTFKCKCCDYYGDSDLNAASNHETDLCEIPYEVWSSHINRSTGFYWLVDGFYDKNYEFIVRNVNIKPSS